MKRPLPLLWQTLQNLPNRAAERREWRLLLADDWPAASRLLRPTGELATAIDCPSPGGDGCPRQVVHRNGGQIIAVCGDRPQRCDSVALVQSDIEVLEFDLSAFRRELVSLLELEKRMGDPANRIFAVGVVGVRAGISLPVFIGFPSERKPISSCDLPALDAGERLGIILAPSARYISTPSHWSILALSKLVGANSDQSLAILDDGMALIEEIKDRFIGGQPKALELAWTLPPDAGWEEVTFHFTADEVLNVRFRNNTKRFEPDQFDMKSKKDGKPTLEWVLLRSIAQAEGTLPLPYNSTKRASVRKQKQTLSQALKKLFGISQDPLRVAGQSYEARFQVIDGRSKRARLQDP